MQDLNTVLTPGATPEEIIDEFKLNNAGKVVSWDNIDFSVSDITDSSCNITLTATANNVNYTGTTTIPCTFTQPTGFNDTSFDYLVADITPTSTDTFKSIMNGLGIDGADAEKFYGVVGKTEEDEMEVNCVIDFQYIPDGTVMCQIRGGCILPEGTPSGTGNGQIGFLGSNNTVSDENINGDVSCKLHGKGSGGETDTPYFKNVKIYKKAQIGIV